MAHTLDGNDAFIVANSSCDLPMDAMVVAPQTILVE